MHLLQLLPPCTQRPLWPKVSLRLLHSDPHHTCAHRMKSPHPGGIQRKLIRREFHTDQVKELITQTSNLCAAEPFYLFILHLFSLICCFPNHPDTSLSPLCLFPRHSTTFYHVSSAAAAFECISWDRCKGSRYYRLCHACRVGQVEEWCNWKEHWHWQVWWGWNLWLKMKTFAPSPQQNAIHPQSCSSPKNKHGELQPHLTFLGKYSNFIQEHHDVLSVPSASTCRTAYITLQKRTMGWADLPGESFPVVPSWRQLCKMKNSVSSQNIFLLISYHLSTWGQQLAACWATKQLVQVCLGMCIMWTEKKWQHC